MPIQLLKDQVIAKIAAGEVVERPVSVVKELLENALDAGARTIQIEVSGGGNRLIRVADDGAGIASDEVLLAFKRHATSKLSDAEDLFRIATLGFRGEALASIASVSQTTLITRHRDETVGTQLRIEGGDITLHKEAGAPAGTLISVENLFYNIPARLKFLKAESTERRQIQSVITRYAMAYPSVRFVLVQDGRELFRSTGSGQLDDVVVKVLGLDIFKQMLEVGGTEILRSHKGEMTVSGFVSEPALHRNDRTQIILFVNGRAIQDSSLSYAVTQAYHTLLEKGRYPIAALMITVPPEFVDVNVHPTKAEVRFQDASLVFTGLQRLVRETLVSFAQLQGMPKRFNTRPPSVQGWHGDDASAQLDLDWSLDQDNGAAGRPQGSGYGGQSHAGSEPGVRPRTLPVLRVVGQVGAAYIVAEGPVGLYLIDQYAAHTRVNYEYLKEQKESFQGIRQTEIEVHTIDLSAHDFGVMGSNLDTLQDCGIDIEAFGPLSYVIRQVPSLVKDNDPSQLVLSILDAAETARKRLTVSEVLRELASVAAIKTGQILTTNEMQSLIQDLERCPEPLSSPDGRPTLIHFTADQLAREFGRDR